MSHYTQYLNHHVGLLQEFKALIEQHSPFNQAAEMREEDRLLMQTLNQLCQVNQHSETVNEQGQWLISRIISAYSHLTPLLPRNLLWFFGGDCLHYMPDDEINFYQQLDELRFSAEESGNSFDYASAKASLTSPH